MGRWATWECCRNKGLKPGAGCGGGAAALVARTGEKSRLRATKSSMTLIQMVWEVADTIAGLPPLSRERVPDANGLYLPVNAPGRMGVARTYECAYNVALESQEPLQNCAQQSRSRDPLPATGFTSPSRSVTSDPLSAQSGRVVAARACECAYGAALAVHSF